MFQKLRRLGILAVLALSVMQASSAHAMQKTMCNVIFKGTKTSTVQISGAWLGFKTLTNPNLFYFFKQSAFNKAYQHVKQQRTPVSGVFYSPNLNIKLMRFSSTSAYKTEDALNPGCAQQEQDAENACPDCSGTEINEEMVVVDESRGSPDLNDARKHLLQFQDCVAWFLPEIPFDRFMKVSGPDGKPTDKLVEKAGRSTGQFVTTKEWADKLEKMSLSQIKEKLGIPSTDWNTSVLYRIDVCGASKFSPRMPTENDLGANDLFRLGGYTSGGVPEALINPASGWTFKKFTPKP